MIEFILQRNKKNNEILYEHNDYMELHCKMKRKQEWIYSSIILKFLL